MLNNDLCTFWEWPEDPTTWHIFLEGSYVSLWHTWRHWQSQDYCPRIQLPCNECVFVRVWRGGGGSQSWYAIVKRLKVVVSTLICSHTNKHLFPSWWELIVGDCCVYYCARSVYIYTKFCSARRDSRLSDYLKCDTEPSTQNSCYILI